MISKSISTSTKLAEVSHFAKVIFTWTIPHCDDYGHMDGNARLVKGIVVPLCEESPEDVEKALKELEKHGLIERYEIDGRQYIEILKWDDHQTLKTDRPLNVRYPLPSTWKPLGKKRNNKRREEKISEVKLSEVKPHASIKYLSTIPKEDMEEFLARFKATEAQIKSKAEDLVLYCERKAKKYANYKSFLLNALKRDFPEREQKEGKFKGL